MPKYLFLLAGLILGFAIGIYAPHVNDKDCFKLKFLDVYSEVDMNLTLIELIDDKELESEDKLIHVRDMLGEAAIGRSADIRELLEVSNSEKEKKLLSYSLEKIEKLENPN